MTTTTADAAPAVLERAEPKRIAPAAAPAKPRKKALIVLPSLLLAAAAGTGATMYFSHGQVTTDDAQVEGHVASVSPRVAGQVVRVNVTDNQHVKAGDVLVELDARDLTARAAAARADVAAARAQLRAMQTQLTLTSTDVDSNLAVARGGMTQAAASGTTSRASIDQARADIAAATAQQALARSELTRTERLFGTGALSQSALDTRRAAVDQAAATLAQAQARLASAESNVTNSAGNLETARGRVIAAQAGPQRVEAAAAQVELAQARLDQTQAALEQAELNLSYASIKAMADGVVSRRNVEVGQLVAPERPLLALVALDDTWVVANFKEDQLKDLRPGQRAELEIDSYPGHPLHAHVDSVAAGTGARFSLLPPDNASGNFTKVVQRVPVLLRLDSPSQLALRPGMSAFAKVFTE